MFLAVAVFSGHLLLMIVSVVVGLKLENPVVSYACFMFAGYILYRMIMLTYRLYKARDK